MRLDLHDQPLALDGVAHMTEKIQNLGFKVLNQRPGFGFLCIARCNDGENIELAATERRCAFRYFKLLLRFGFGVVSGYFDNPDLVREEQNSGLLDV